MTSLRAYLDNNATTQLAPEALAAMMPYLTDLYVNASSTAGELMQADKAIVDAKRQLGSLFGNALLADRFFLTSGASEANSWAVHAATWQRPPGHMVASAIEHPSLLAALNARTCEGWEIELVHPSATGRIDPAEFQAHIRPDTTFVTVMAANNETGVIQPIAEIGRGLREISPAALFHVDATQAPGRIAMSFDEELADVDLFSLSAHKFHGPKGIGALFVAEGRLPALVHGSQESGQRGGTLNTAAAAGMAVAAKLARCRIGEAARIYAMRDRFEGELRARVPNVQFLGAGVERLPNTSAFWIPRIDAESLVDALARIGVAVSSGAACSNGATAPSHVLTAMGLDYDSAKAALRVSLSRLTTEQEIDTALEQICDIIQVLA